MSEDNEAELVGQLKQGSTMAYQKILEIHLPSISRYVVRMTGNPSDAEDITQDVFIRLWQKSSQFNPAAARLTTWLHKIAHNLCIDHFRKLKSDTREYQDESIDATDPVQQLVDLRATASITAAMLGLPERQRSAIVMCHYRGLSNKEAAVILDISIDALESLLSRGRNKLRHLLNGATS